MDKRYHHGALRDALLVAAERILQRDGASALTLRAVAREAGVSHGSPVHHFRDFSELLSVVAARGFDRLAEAMALAADNAGTIPEARLGGLGRGYVCFARDQPQLFLLMFRSGQLDDTEPTLTAARSAAFNLLTSGDLAPAALIQAAQRWAAVHGLALLAIDGRLQSVAARAKLSEDALIAAILVS